jgi:hypothetical protein
MSLEIPITSQDISDRLRGANGANLFELRKQTISKIEGITGIPLICYVSKTSGVPRGTPVSIDEDDIIGFSDLITTTQGDSIDIFLISNGGSPEAAERIVKLIRGKYSKVRFLISGNAYSAATMMCLAADEIIMHRQGTLGPIDPQIGGIPAYSILESFENVQKRLKDEGPSSLTAYMPLISKYDLHLLSICRSAQELSKELASQYLKQYMKKDDDTIKEITKFFMDHETHKSHGRSIDRDIALGQGLNIIKSEEIKDKNGDPSELDNLLLSLFNQFQFFLGQSGFYKLYENTRGINWGKAIQSMQQLQVPIQIPNNPPQFPKP